MVNFNGFQNFKRNKLNKKFRKNDNVKRKSTKQMYEFLNKNRIT